MLIFICYVRTSVASENGESTAGSEKTVSSGSEDAAGKVQLKAAAPTGDVLTKGPGCGFLLISAFNLCAEHVLYSYQCACDTWSGYATCG